MKIGYIYKIICPFTELPVYVGKTTTSIDYRLKKHILKTKTKVKYNRKLSKMEYWINEMIKKSITDLIKIEIIEECNLNIINDREIYWIAEYKKNFKLKNLTAGGDGGNGHKHTEESLKKISENRKGKYCGKEHHNYGKKIGNEPWFKLSNLMKSEDNPNIGKSKSNETKKKISISNSGEKNGMYGKRIKRTELQKNKLSKSLKNSQKLKESRNNVEYKKKLSQHFSIPILVLDNEFNIVYEFENTKTCAEFFKCTKGNIANAIRFKRQIGKGKNYKYWIVRKKDFLSNN